MVSQKTVSNQKGIQDRIVLQEQILQIPNFNFQVFQIDKESKLFISQAIETIDDWNQVFLQEITVVFDLDEEVDKNIPRKSNYLVYVYFPIEDRYLPNLKKLHEIAKMGAILLLTGSKVLCHCAMGHNRSALLAGVILTYLGLTGEEALRLIQEKRQGALYNQTFATYLKMLPKCNESLQVIQDFYGDYYLG